MMAPSTRSIGSISANNFFTANAPSPRTALGWHPITSAEQRRRGTMPWNKMRGCHRGNVSASCANFASGLQRTARAWRSLPVCPSPPQSKTTPSVTTPFYATSRAYPLSRRPSCTSVVSLIISVSTWRCTSRPTYSRRCTMLAHTSNVRRPSCPPYCSCSSSSAVGGCSVPLQRRRHLPRRRSRRSPVSRGRSVASHLPSRWSAAGRAFVSTVTSPLCAVMCASGFSTLRPTTTSTTSQQRRPPQTAPRLATWRGRPPRMPRRPPWWFPFMLWPGSGHLMPCCCPCSSRGNAFSPSSTPAPHTTSSKGQPCDVSASALPGAWTCASPSLTVIGWRAKGSRVMCLSASGTTTSPSHALVSIWAPSTSSSASTFSGGWGRCCGTATPSR